MEQEGADKIIIEVSTNHEDYQKMLIESIQNMKEKDILLIKAFDDLGESVVDIINIVKKLDEKDIGLQVLDNPNTYDVNDWNVQTILRKQLLFILNWVEGKERNDIRMRQAKGIERFKALKEKKGTGRPKKYSQYAKDPNDREIYYAVVDMLENNVAIKRIAETLNISRNTIYTIKEELQKHTNENSQ